MNYTALAIVIVGVSALIFARDMFYSKRDEKRAEMELKLFIQMMRERYPQFVDSLNEESCQLFLHEWRKRRDDGKVHELTRLFFGVKRGQKKMFGGFQSSIDEFKAATYVLKECGPFISNKFKEHVLEIDTSLHFFAIEDMVKKAKSAAR